MRAGVDGHAGGRRGLRAGEEARYGGEHQLFGEHTMVVTPPFVEYSAAADFDDDEDYDE